MLTERDMRAIGLEFNRFRMLFQALKDYRILAMICVGFGMWIDTDLSRRHADFYLLLYSVWSQSTNVTDTQTSCQRHARYHFVLENAQPRKPSAEGKSVILDYCEAQDNWVEVASAVPCTASICILHITMATLYHQIFAGQVLFVSRHRANRIKALNDNVMNSEADNCWVKIDCHTS